MAFVNDICAKVEAATVAFLQAQTLANFLPAQIVGGLNPEDRALPHVECICTDAAPEKEDEGNWIATLTINIRTNIDDTPTIAQHRAQAGEVFSYFNTFTLADDLTAALADFTCWKKHDGPAGYTIVGRSWVSHLTLTLDCCGSDIG